MPGDMVQALGLAVQVLQVAVIPGIWFVGKTLWGMDRRLFAIEMRLGIAGQVKRR